MGMVDYKKAVAILKKDYKGHMRCAGPKPEKVITAAEEILGFRFPPSYHQFCLDYGAGKFGDTAIFGVLEKSDYKHDYARQYRHGMGEDYVPKKGEEFELLDTVSFTLEQRKLGLPTNLLAIKSYGYSHFYCLYITDPSGKKEGPVIAWGRGLKELKPKKILPAADYGVLWKDFGKFFLFFIKLTRPD